MQLLRITAVIPIVAIATMMFTAVAQATDSPFEFQQVKPTLQINIPTFKLSDVRARTVDGIPTEVNIPWIGEYIAAIYRWAVPVGAIIATVVIMVAGVIWLTSGGAGTLSTAKEWITNAVIGLLLLVGSYVLLNLVNPDLIQFSPLRIRLIERVVVDEAEEPIGTPATVPTTGRVPYFGQYQSPWGSKTPGNPEWPMAGIAGRNCLTIQKRGCGTTSLAMVLVSYGVATDPLDTARWGLGCMGGWSSRGTLSKLSERWPGFRGEYVGKDEALELLRQGRPLIISCHACEGFKPDGTPARGPTRSHPDRSPTEPWYKNGHFIVAVGMDNSGNVLINDPGGNAERIAWMTIEQFRASSISSPTYVHPN